MIENLVARPNAVPTQLKMEGNKGILFSSHSSTHKNFPWVHCKEKNAIDSSLPSITFITFYFELGASLVPRAHVF